MESISPEAELEMIPDSLVAPDADMMVSNDTDGLNHDDQIDDFESALENEIEDLESQWNGELPPATPMVDTDPSQFEEIVVESIEQDDTQYDFPKEDAPGQRSSNSASAPSTDFAPTTTAITAPLHVDTTANANSPPSSVIPLNEYVQTTNSQRNTDKASELPKIICLVGSSKQVQANPSVIRMSELFKNDSRIITNPMYSQIADQHVVENRGGSSNHPNPKDPGREASNPNSQPYQIRTTALPATSTKSGNDFVPQR